MKKNKETIRAPVDKFAGVPLQTCQQLFLNQIKWYTFGM